MLQEDGTPYSFFVNEKEITDDLAGITDESTSEERVMTILYQPQAVFRVRAVTRYVCKLSHCILKFNFQVVVKTRMPKTDLFFYFFFFCYPVIVFILIFCPLSLEI